MVTLYLFGVRGGRKGGLASCYRVRSDKKRILSGYDMIPKRPEKNRCGKEHETRALSRCVLGEQSGASGGRNPIRRWRRGVPQLMPTRRKNTLKEASGKKTQGKVRAQALSGGAWGLFRREEEVCEKESEDSADIWGPRNTVGVGSDGLKGPEEKKIAHLGTRKRTFVLRPFEVRKNQGHAVRGEKNCLDWRGSLIVV